MSGPVIIPLWLFILLVAIVILMVLDKVLIPGARWFIRRRINRIIDDIGTRLDIEIKPIQITKRQVLIDRLVYDTKVVEAINNEALARDIPRETVQRQVATFAREIVPSFNAYLYFRIGYWLAKKVAHRLYRVRVGLIDNEQLSAIDPDATVVFVMNHRSNMDYLLVAFLAAERTTLSYAVGEWAKIWPLQTLIRAMGAFFVRRNSSNPLYRRVLERYVHMAAREGVCQAVFPEGGLSKDGRPRTPKLGIIDYMLRDYNPTTDRDIVFIPVGLNYDRILEDRSLLHALDPSAEQPGKWFVIKTSLRFMAKSLKLMITSRWRRFGYACVNFGPHLSIRRYCEEQSTRFDRLDRPERFKEVEKLCRTMMGSVQKIVPVLPVPLVARIFLDHSQVQLSAFDVELYANRLIDEIQSRGAPVYVSSRSRVQHVVTALNMLKIRRIVKEKDGLFQSDPQMHEILTFYANSLSRWIPEKNTLS
jgi:glycerol-3-phosphate O-acyltransferase